ncbi:hypothetical protein A8M60_04605 [Nocardia farcinica]|nr:hypothetical protein A8M60_04605 [Nocardia farcinica]
MPACTAVSSPAFLALTRTVLRDRPLWVLWGSAIANSVVAPAVLIYITRTLDVPVTVVGVIFAIGSVGGILGGLVVGRVLTAFSVRDALLGSVAIGLISAVSLLGASEWESALYPLLVLYEFASAFSGTLIVATVFGLLQVNSGSSTVARVLTVASTGLELCGLLGIGLGSLISEAATTRTVVAVSCGMYAVLVVFAVLVLAGQSGRDSSEAPTP